MQYTKALVIKFVMITAVLWIVLGPFFDVSLGDILITSVALTGVSFVLGDLMVLPKFGNMIATCADMGLAFIGIWILGALLFEEPMALGVVSFFLAAAITVGEFFLHGYLKGPIMEDYSSTEKQDMDLYADKNLQTEFASEEDMSADVEEFNRKPNATGDHKEEQS